jgi:type II secretory pathway component PulF
MNRKGNIGSLYPTILALVLIGMLLGAGLLILDKFKDSMTASSSAQNATVSTITSLATIPTTWLPVLVVVIVAGLIISYLVGAFGGKQR